MPDVLKRFIGTRGFVGLGPFEKVCIIRLDLMRLFGKLYSANIFADVCTGRLGQVPYRLQYA